MKTNEIIHVTAIIEQVFREQALYDAGDHSRLAALVKQFPCQFHGSVVAAR
jgi:hypothetical protein